MKGTGKQLMEYGEYISPNGMVRTYFANPVGGVCLYTFGSVVDRIMAGQNDDGFVAYLCSKRTLVKATSAKPRRTFTPAEVHKLVGHMRPPRAPKYSNAIERIIFHSEIGKKAALDSLPPAPVTVLPPALEITPKPAEPRPATVWAKIAQLWSGVIRHLAWWKPAPASAAQAAI
jgi:hypothetical protein